MAIVARVIGVSLLAAALGVAIGNALFGQYPDGAGISFVLACVGALIGGVAGAAREVVIGTCERGRTEKLDR